MVAKTFSPAQILRLSDESLAREYNPAQAKVLLKKAGYPDGFETTIDALDIPRPYMPDPPKVAQDIKKDLESIGIKAKIRILHADDNAESPIPKGNYDMLLNGWMADTADPNDYFTLLLVSDSINYTNLTRWSNKKFDDLIEKARNQTNAAERLKTYYQAQAIFHEQMPFVPLFYSLQTSVWNKKLIGFVPHPLNRLYLQYLSLQ